MADVHPVERYSPRPGTLGVVFANVLPLVGVAALGWDVVALLVLYWLELGVLCAWALVRALFAGRPSELDPDQLIVGVLASKPVAVPIPRTDLRVQVSTLPVLAVTVPMLALLWFFAGVTTVGIVGADAPDPDALATVVLAGFGIFVGEGTTTFVGYFRNRRYREHSAQTAIQGVFVRGAVIGLGGMFTAVVAGMVTDSVATDDPITAVDTTVVGVPLLVGIVLVKFGFDLADRYRNRLVEFDEATDVRIGWAYEPPTHDSVDTTLSDAGVRLRPTVRGRLLGGLADAGRHPGAWVVGVLFALFAAVFALGRAWTVTVALAVGSVVVPLFLVGVDYWLRYGGVEYRVDDEAVVAYDRLFRTPLWRVEAWDERGLRVERDRVDRWLDTSTVVVELPDRDLRLPRLREVEPVLDVFDRRATGPDSE